MYKAIYKTAGTTIFCVFVFFCIAGKAQYRTSGNTVMELLFKLNLNCSQLRSFSCSGIEGDQPVKITVGCF